MLPNKPLISNNSINNTSTNTTNSTYSSNTNIDNPAQSGASFQAKRKPNSKMDTSNSGTTNTSTPTNKPTGLAQQKQSSGSQHHHSHHHHHANNDSKFYVMSSIEIKDPLENTLEDAYNKLKHLIMPNNQQPDNILFNELSNYSNQSKAQYDEVCNALLYSILSDPANSSRCLRNLFLCNNFNFSSSSVSSSIGQSSLELNSSATSYVVLINNLNSIITENYQRLLDTPRQQLIWLLRELVKARVTQCERLLLQMLRHIQSGSLAEKNYWLAESMLDILSEVQVNQTNDSSSASSSLWIYSSNELLTQTLYTYLRVIADHGQAVALTQLRQRETEFCIQILREKWTECMQIGRDLVRLLENLAKIPEFEQLWRDITQSPQTLSPQFAQLGGLLHLMRLPSRRRCLISRLTIDMERKIYFIITSVKAGQQKRYLDWFQRQYLNTPESQSLRVDILRYILVVVHPTNEQLNSGLTPRWSLCAWLINTCTNQIELANLKLALFYDWLFYDAKKDNIMLIEPAILLMFNSIRSQTPPINSSNNNLSPNLTNSLFDFLCRISVNYHWPYREQILNGVMQSFKDSVDKRVIPSMQVFFANLNEQSTNPTGKFPNQAQGSVLAPDLKALIQNTFGNFFQTLNINQVPPVVQQQQSPVTSTPPQPVASQPLIKQTESTAPLAQSPSFGSGLSLFKQRVKNESDDSLSSSSGFSESAPTSGNASPLSISFQSYFKTEPTSEIKQPQQDQLPNSNEFTSLAKTEAQFSSDEDEDSKPAAETLVNIKSNPTIQKQLLLFTSRPFKIFTSLEECHSALVNTQNLLENHLNLIQSDDLRDKLNEFNDKVKELNTTPSSSSDNLQQLGSLAPSSFNYLSTMFKDILVLINKDTDILNHFHTSLADIAISVCLILKNDFNNHLLPSQIYSKSNANTQFVSLFSPNTSLINMITENTLNQRLIFVLFKELSQTPNQSASREILTQLLHEIYLKQNRIGYYFLFYIYLINLKSVTTNSKAKTDQKSLIDIYLEFTKERRNEIKVELKQKQQQVSSDDDVVSNEASESQSDTSAASSSSNEHTESEHASSSESDDELLDEDDLILGECFMQDIRLCQQDDPYLFCFMLPFILKELHDVKKANFMINNSELCYLICSCIDAKQLKDLIASVTSQEIVLLKDKSLRKTSKANGKKSTRSNVDDAKANKKRKRTSDTGKKSSKQTKKKSNKKKSKTKKLKQKSKLKKQCLWNVLEASLAWESIEQIFFWQILTAHDDIDLTSLLPLFGKLDAQNHCEANFNLFQVLKTNEPSYDLVKFLINRRLDENMEKALFVHWIRRFNAGDIKIAQIFCKLLNKSALASNQTQSQSTLKKIKINESNNNRKLTAEQQLEIANQQKASNRSLGRLLSIEMDQIPSLDQVLSCLFKLRLNNECMKFILKENVLETLQKVYKKYCDDEMKKKYSDLFTLADEFSETDRKNENENEEEDEEQEEEDDENDTENESNEDENSSESNGDSDSNEAPVTKNKKLKSSPRTTKNSMSKPIAKTATATSKSTKRTIKSFNSKTSKKQKIKNSNSSDSEKEEKRRSANNNSKDTSESENTNSDDESDSSTERKRTKNARKK